MSLRRIAYGPYCTAAGRLTSEGQRLLTEWLIEHPEPGRLLRKKFPALYSAAMRKYDWEELKSLCLAGACKAMRNFEPTKGFAFSTYVCHWMRAEVGLALRGENASERYGCRLHSGFRLTKDGEEFDPLAGLPSRPAGDSADQSEYLRRRVLEIIKRAVPSFKHRQMYMMWKGLGGWAPMRLYQIGEIFDVSPSRAQQLVRNVAAKILPGLADLYGDQVQ